MSPPYISTSTIVYPMPTWEERIFDPHTTTTELVFYALAASGMLLCIFFGIITIIYRNHKVVKCATWKLLIIMLIGNMISLSSIFAWNMNNISNTTCTLIPILVGIGFIVTFTPLF